MYNKKIFYAKSFTLYYLKKILTLIMKLIIFFILNRIFTKKIHKRKINNRKFNDFNLQKIMHVSYIHLRQKDLIRLKKTGIKITNHDTHVFLSQNMINIVQLI